VNVDVFKGYVDEEAIKGYDVVVVTDNFDKEHIKRLNEYCHSHNMGFIYGAALGLYTTCFVDFGEKHKISDKNGTPVKQSFIQLITNDKKAHVILPQGQTHTFHTGDLVTFKGVTGMTELNGN